jgi:hypothetical protein
MHLDIRNRKLSELLDNLNLCTYFKICFCFGLSRADVLQLNNDNIEEALNTHELVIVNFYADWCRFSQNLKPDFLKSSDQLKVLHG